jgi:2-polyprenyl-3-methyl-5-hydroxy-6-metoxy-1,4-benzoquinol methylase
MSYELRSSKFKSQEDWLSGHANVSDAKIVLRFDKHPHGILHAYAIRTDDAEKNVETLNYVKLWSRIFDGQYVQSEHSSSHEKSRDVGVWKSSYTGKPIDKVDMLEWVDTTVEKIKKHCKPESRVLEIGTGTGLMMFPLLNHIAQYVGTDSSGEAVKKLKSLAHSECGSTEVSFYHTDASGLSGLGIGQFDIVIINSVVQYFPNLDYFITVLNSLEGLLAENSIIFIGDIRAYHLKDFFYTDVILHQSNFKCNSEQLLEGVHSLSSREKETLYHPLFFSRIKNIFPWISSVDNEIRNGSCLNEMNKFRFDSVLTCKSLRPNPTTSLIVKWDDAMAIEEIKAILDSSHQQAFIMENFPYHRISALAEINFGLKENEKNSPSFYKANFDLSGASSYETLNSLLTLISKYFTQISVGFDSHNGPARLSIRCAKRGFLLPEIPVDEHLEIYEFSNRIGQIDLNSEFFKTISIEFNQFAGSQQQLGSMEYLSRNLMKVLS